MVETATIKDIARELSISNVTVSRALRGTDYVSPELKEKIFKTAEELNYLPNMLAIGLRTRKTKVISLIVPYFRNPIFIDFLIYIEKLASKDNISVIFCTTDEDITIEEKHVQMLDMGLVDGAILVPCIRKSPSNEYIHRTRKKNIVLFNRKIEGFNFDIVQFDQQKTVYMAMEYLYKLGYRRIAAISGDLNTSVAKERFSGYRKALHDFGLVEKKALIKHGAVTKENGYKSTLQLLNMNHPPEVIFALNNIFTIGSLKAIKEKNKKIPEDIAFISMDDIYNSELIEPKITYIKQNTYQMAKCAYEILSDRINQKDRNEVQQHKEEYFQAELVIRDSCSYHLKNQKK